jgi:hypothetical protein
MKAPARTLSNIVDGYCIRQFNNSQKYFSNYLMIAKDVWIENFIGTISAVKNTIVNIVRCEPYDYVEVPADLDRFIGLNVLDDHNVPVPVFMNDRIVIGVQPNAKSKCDKCDGSSLGCDIDNLQMTTRTIVIDNNPYTENKWIRVLADGSVIEYTETPLKEIKEDYTPQIVIEKTQRTICKLTVKECGCPEDTEENKLLFYKNCGCNILCASSSAASFICNQKKVVGLKLSEDGKKIFIAGIKAKFAQFVFQSTGEDGYNELVIPNSSEAWNTMWFGIDYWSKILNPRIGDSEKNNSKIRYEDAKTKLFLYFNPITFQGLEAISGGIYQWGRGVSEPVEKHNHFLRGGFGGRIITVSEAELIEPPKDDDDILFNANW